MILYGLWVTVVSIWFFVTAAICHLFPRIGFRICTSKRLPEGVTSISYASRFGFWLSTESFFIIKHEAGAFDRFTEPLAYREHDHEYQGHGEIDTLHRFLEVFGGTMKMNEIGRSGSIPGNRIQYILTTRSGTRTYWTTGSQ